MIFTRPTIIHLITIFFGVGLTLLHIEVGEFYIPKIGIMIVGVGFGMVLCNLLPKILVDGESKT